MDCCRDLLLENGDTRAEPDPDERIHRVQSAASTATEAALR